MQCTLAHQVLLEWLREDVLTQAWHEVPLERIGNHMRADVLSLQPGFFWEHADVRIFEIKTNRADFLGDVRRRKSYGYLPYAHRVYYAGPSGVFSEEEVPPEFGVVTWDPEGVHVVREAPFEVCPENTGLLLYLMGRGEE